MCSIERLLFLLKYGIAYVKEEKEVDGVIESRDEKHIMRYQQMFAALTVREKIKSGCNVGRYLAYTGERQNCVVVLFELCID